ncbi:11162_t:CDS:2 [Dentiscutata heterogama]|uniref:11162_t:CDS:1 n=1 Tax=Dentiscutata heterogama TaxID=1316150 RepID=A0ACA9M6F6_9GLOM|nr:11162_t:CDS:2 [Dentiscutata heterogama]
MGLSHSSKVITYPHEEIYPRLDILDMTSNQSYAPQFDLLIQSFQALQDRPYDDMRSFYQIAGIHGLPFTAYDGIEGAYPYRSSEFLGGRWGGYCHHGDVIFPTWHRAYALLLEGQLRTEAKEIANKYPSDQKDKYVEAAKQLRHPYWDWADEKAIKGVPDVFITPTLEINTPNGKQKVKNPLKSYTLPVDLADPLPKGLNPNDANYTVPNVSYIPFTPKGYQTVRHPNNKNVDQVDIMNINMSTYIQSVFRPGFYQMFHISDFTKFSNHGLTSKGGELPDFNPGHPKPFNRLGFSHFASWETTHDGFHVVIGGTGGHMTYVDIASFDPIFSFHHVNMDRIFALWQKIYPNSWIISNIDVNGTYTNIMGEVINEYTELTPFRKSETEFWTSDDVRDFTKLGYTYPEVEKFYGNSTAILNYVLELYKPDPHYDTRFFVKVTIESGKVKGPFVIRVFVDLPSADSSTPTTSPNFAGFVAMWQSDAHNSTFVEGTVDITAAMERLNIRTQKHDFVHEVNLTTGLVNPASLFNIGTDINLVPVMIDGSEILPEAAGVKLVEVFSFEHDKVDKNFLVESTGQYYTAKKF